VLRGTYHGAGEAKHEAPSLRLTHPAAEHRAFYDVTELPEKINSVLWVREGKDTLTLGNITGAMVFQSTVPVIFGVLFTSWELGPLNLFSAALALVSGGLIYLTLRRDAALHSWHLMVGGVFYLAFFVAAVFAVI
jgi:cation:H+ antiporter